MDLKESFVGKPVVLITANITRIMRALAKFAPDIYTKR